MTQLRPGGGRFVDPRSTQHPLRQQHPHALSLCEILEVRQLLSTYYVSTSGSDDADGQSLGGAFRTIQRAATRAEPGDTVLVRGGTYRETVTPAHSGTSSAPIVYKPYNGERVTVSGADRVSGWSKHSGPVYKAPQDWDLGTGKNQVFVDGRMMIEARWPNTTLDVSRPKKAVADDIDASGDYATLKDSALTQGSDYWNGATVHFAAGEGWVTQTGRVTDSAPGRLNFSFDNLGRKAGPTGGDPYFLTGKFKALDNPTEWFRDGDGTLYLWAQNSDDPSGHTVEAKRRDYAFNLSNREYIHLEGFDLFAATVVSNPNSSHLRLSGLNAWYLSHFTVMPDGWEQEHDTGLYLDGHDNVLSDSVVAFSAGHGVMVAGHDNRVENNVVRDADYNGGDAAGIRVAGSGHVVNRNTVYNAGRSGIKISNATDLKITRNVIHDVMLQTTDGGGVYTFGMDGRGTEIAWNKIYNIKTGGFGGTGVFLDNSSSNYNVHHNVIWNVNHALKLNYTSRGHRIYNNTLDGTDTSVGASSSSRMPGVSFKNNIFTNEVKIAGEASESNNIYDGTDPKFSDEGDADFTLRSGSPAIDRGAKASPYTDGYAGSAPDIGAMEYGKSGFSAGANLSVKTPPPTAPPVRPPGTPGTPGTPGRPGNVGGQNPGQSPPDDGEPTPEPTTPPPFEGPIYVAPPPTGISVAEVVPVKLPQRIVAGQRAARGRVNVVLKNEGTTAAAGPVTVTLLASADAAVTPDADLPLARLKRMVRLKPGESRAVPLRVRFLAPATAAGDYLLLASAAGAPVSTRSLAQSTAAVRVEAPAAQIAPAPPKPGEVTAGPLSLKLGQRASLTVPVINVGNVAADPLDVELRLSPDGALATSVPLATVTGVRAAIAAGSVRPLRVTFDMPAPGAVAAGSYTLLVKLTTSDTVLASVIVMIE